MRAALVAASLALLAASARAEDIEVAATAIDHFDAGTPIGATYGELIFLGGLQLRSRNPDFGGVSGLRLSPDGSRFAAISDRGVWFRGAVAYDGSRPAGLTGVARDDIPGRDGKPLHGRRGFDTEALEVEGAAAWVASEKVNWLTRYALDGDGAPEGRGVAVALPAAARRAPFNEGYEAMAALSSGAIVLIGEKYLDGNGDNRGFVVGGRAPFDFSVRRTDNFSPVDLARLPDGDLVLLERRYRPPFSLAIRIRRLQVKDIRAGAVVDGPILMEATLAQTIDNFEAISAHRGAGGATVITIASDDNFSFLQRTLLMQFALAD